MLYCLQSHLEGGDRVEHGRPAVLWRVRAAETELAVLDEVLFAAGEVRASDYHLGT